MEEGGREGGRDKITSLMQWRRDKITSNVHSLKICGALEGSDLDHPDVIVLELPTGNSCCICQ